MLGDPTFPLDWKSDGTGPDEQALTAWCAYTGQPEQTVQNWGWLDTIHPADRANVQKTWQEVGQGPHVFSLTYRIHHGKDVYPSFKVLHVPVFNDAQHLQSWLVFFGAESAPTPVLDEYWELRLINSMIYTQTVLGILCLSLDGAVLRVNARLCQLTSYTEAELLSRTLWQLSVSEDVHVQLQAMRDRLHSSQSYPPFRMRYRRKDGTPTWVCVTQFLVRMPSSEPYYFFYVIEDVNSQVQAEAERAELLARVQEAHRDSLARTRQLETIFESITDGILVCDSSGRIVQSNTALKHIVHADQYPGYFQMLLTQRVEMFQAFDEQGQRFNIDQWPLVRLLKGEDLRGNDAVEMRLLLPDGKDLYLSLSGSPLRDQDEQIVGAVLAIRDVTERRVIEKRVQKSFGILLALAEELMHVPEKYDTAVAARSIVPALAPFQRTGQYLVELIKQMLEYQGASISLLDVEDGRFHMIAMSGRSEQAKAIYYRNFGTFALTDYLDASTIRALQEDEVVLKEIRLRATRPLPITLLLAPMLLGGELVGVLSVKKFHPYATSYSAEEISLVKAMAKLVLLVIERERLQHEWIEAHTSELALRETNRRFDEFLSIASHELRTPLAGIKGNIQLALRRLAFLRDPELPEKEILLDRLEKVYDYLRHAEHRVNVQNRMISDLLDVSRIQANKLELVKRPCNLVEIVRQAVEDQHYMMSERVITLKVPAHGDFTVLGDADRLGQVVHNYLTNALKYSPVEQPVAVSLAINESKVRVSVRDQGPGLSPEEQEHVWERFYRVKGISTQGDEAAGLGLGLHICRAIIEAHHGGFGLESAPGQGSTFWFSLPLAHPAPSAPEKQAPALREHASGM